MDATKTNTPKPLRLYQSQIDNYHRAQPSLAQAREVIARDYGPRYSLEPYTGENVYCGGLLACFYIVSEPDSYDGQRWCVDTIYVRTGALPNDVEVIAF